MLLLCCFFCVCFEFCFVLCLCLRSSCVVVVMLLFFSLCWCWFWLCLLFLLLFSFVECMFRCLGSLGDFFFACWFSGFALLGNAVSCLMYVFNVLHCWVTPCLLLHACSYFALFCRDVFYVACMFHVLPCWPKLSFWFHLVVHACIVG